MFKTFEELPEGTKIVDIEVNGKRVDGQILEVRHSDGYTYLCSDKSMWGAFQFTPSDYELYTGDKKVGDYLC